MKPSVVLAFIATFVFMASEVIAEATGRYKGLSFMSMLAMCFLWGVAAVPRKEGRD